MSRYLKGRRYALQLVAVELIITLAVSATGLLASDRIAFSLLIGGLICTSANCWLALVVFRPPLGATPGKMLSAFYVGEIGKFVLTALLFMLAFRQFEWLKEAANALALFTGYLFALASFWVFPLLKK